MKRQKARKNVDYTLDPITSRATFKKNNKAALIHGGYSREINENLLEAILDNDLGFEVGVLKGQLTNIHTLGSELTQKLLLQGEEATALNVALSCADRASKLVPQIQKALESPLTADFELDAKKLRQKNRWLKRFHAGECSASDVAYQFEVNNLGQLPLYVMKKLEAEIKSAPSDIDNAQYSREELQQQLMEYWQETASEEQLRNEREQAIQREKKRISDRFFNSSNATDLN